MSVSCICTIFSFQLIKLTLAKKSDIHYTFSTKHDLYMIHEHVVDVKEHLKNVCMMCIHHMLLQPHKVDSNKKWMISSIHFEQNMTRISYMNMLLMSNWFYEMSVSCVSTIFSWNLIKPILTKKSDFHYAFSTKYD